MTVLSEATAQSAAQAPRLRGSGTAGYRRPLDSEGQPLRGSESEHGKDPLHVTDAGKSSLRRLPVRQRIQVTPAVVTVFTVRNLRDLWIPVTGGKHRGRRLNYDGFMTWNPILG